MLYYKKEEPKIYFKGGEPVVYYKNEKVYPSAYASGSVEIKPNQNWWYPFPLLNKSIPAGNYQVDCEWVYTNTASTAWTGSINCQFESITPNDYVNYNYAISCFYPNFNPWPTYTIQPGKTLTCKMYVGFKSDRETWLAYRALMTNNFTGTCDYKVLKVNAVATPSYTKDAVMYKNIEIIQG